MALTIVCVLNQTSRLIDLVPGVDGNVNPSLGPASAGTPVVLNPNGLLDPSLTGTGVNVTAGEALSQYDIVNLYSQVGHPGIIYAQKAWGGNTGTSPSTAPYPVAGQGFITTLVGSGSVGSVSLGGIFTYIDNNSEFSETNVGAEVFLRWQTPESTSGGGITLTQTSTAGQLNQSIGYVIAFTSPNIVTCVFLPAAAAGGEGIVSISQGGTSANNGPQALLNLIGGTPVLGEVLAFNGTHWVGSNSTVVALAPTTGVGLSITGDGSNHDLQDFYVNGQTGATWGLAAQPYGDPQGVQLSFQDSSGNTSSVSPTEFLANDPAGDNTSVSASGIFSETNQGYISMGGGSTTFVGTSLYMLPNSGSFGGSGTGIPLVINGAGGDILRLYSDGQTSLWLGVDVDGNLYLNSGLKDSTGSLGSSGYVLSTTGTQTLWVPQSGGGGTPGGSNGQLQFNNSGAFGGAANSSVSGTGAINLGNTTNGGPTASTALTVNGSGGISTSIQDWYSSNEGTVVGQMLTSGRFICNGVNIISNVSIGAFPALNVIGGQSGSPDIADFTTAGGATPASTKVFWLDFNGNVHILQGLYDSTGSLGTSGQVLSTTGTQTVWVNSSASAGGSPTEIQYNLGGALTGIPGSQVSPTGAVAIAPTGPISPLTASLELYPDAGGSPVLQIYGDADLSDPAITVDFFGGMKFTPTKTGDIPLEIDALDTSANLIVLKDPSTSLVFYVGPTGYVAITPTSGAHPSLYVQDDTGGVNDIADFYDPTGTYNVVAIAQPNTGGFAAISVTGDTNANNIADFYCNGFPSHPAIYMDSGGALWLQNPGVTTDTIELYDTTFEILSATGQAQASLSGVPHFHLSDTTPSVMDLYTSYLGFGGSSSDTFLYRISSGVFGVGQTGIAPNGTVATGGIATGITTKTSAYQPTQYDHTINCNGTFTITLPTTGIQVGQEYYIKNIGTGTITVSSTANIDFSTSLSLTTQGQSVTVQWDGTQWWIY